MAENETNQENNPEGTNIGGTESQEQAQAGFSMQRIYVKDVSFESPNSPEIFQKEWDPNIKMDLNTKHNKVGDNLYEVVVCITLTATVEDMTAYIVEVQQAGIFVFQGLEGGQLAQALNAFCPNLLFPYLRETIDTTLVKGSFPAMMLAPVNFDALFAQTVMQKQKESQAAAAAAGDSFAE